MRRNKRGLPASYTYASEKNYNNINAIFNAENSGDIINAERIFEDTRKTMRSIGVWLGVIENYNNNTKESAESKNQKIGIIYLVMAGIAINTSHDDLSRNHISLHFTAAASFFRKSGDTERADNVMKLSEQYKMSA